MQCAKTVSSPIGFPPRHTPHRGCFCSARCSPPTQSPPTPNARSASSRRWRRAAPSTWWRASSRRRCPRCSGRTSSSTTAAAPTTSSAPKSSRARRPTATRCWSPPARTPSTPRVYKKLPYDALRDFTPIIHIVQFRRPRHRGASVVPRADAAGTHRHGESQPGQDRLRLGGLRQPHAHRRRAVSGDGGHQAHAHPVQERGAGDQRSRRRADSADVRPEPGAGADGAGRAAARPRLSPASSARRNCPTCRPPTSSASRVTKPPAGTASTARAACRAPSSSCSTAP